MVNFISIHRVPLYPQIQKQQTKQIIPSNNDVFLKQLHEASNYQDLKVSKHANERLNERNISISEKEWQLVTEKVFEAREKGVNQPLVLMDHAALIVSAKNSTVITAMGRTEAKQQIFTNIDGTIIL